MAFDFKGKKVLVTGAGKGIGRGVATALHKARCKVYALSRTKSTLDSLVEECPGIIPIVADLCHWEDTREKLEKLEVLDGLVNNAGIGAFDCAAIDCTKKYTKYVLNNNLLSAINYSQVVAKKMIEAKVQGSIVNCSSVGSLAAYPKALPYTVSKAGMDMVTKQFALELGPHGIRVNSVNPATVKTPLLQSLIDQKTVAIDKVVSRMPLGRILSVEDVVDPILYLLSDHSVMVTGHLHIIDGGRMSNITIKV